jgi:hypothetical protein
VHGVAAHLRDCAACRAELVEQAAGHAALTSARRTLSLRPAGPGPTDNDQPLPPLPSLPSLAGRSTRLRRGAGWRRRYGGLAAAAAVLVLVAGGVVVGRSWPQGSRPAPSAVRQAALVAVGREAPSASGIVQMSGPDGRTDMTIRTTGLPPAATGHFYYAWLLDPATNKMLPLGVVAVDAASTFEVQTDLVGRYRAVDISLQADDGNPAHSPVSVLRATYA